MAIIVVAMVLGIGALWIANIEPVATGPERYGVSGHGLHVTTRKIAALGVTGTVQTVPMRPDMTFRYRFSIENTGGLPITVVDAGSHERQGITTTLVSANPALDTPGGPGTFGPFAPFRLPPGQAAALTMQVHVPADACYARDSYAVWYEEPLIYRVLGITRHAEVSTGTEIRLGGTDATAC